MRADGWHSRRDRFFDNTGMFYGKSPLWLNDQVVLILWKRLPLIWQKLSQAVYGMTHGLLQEIIEGLNPGDASMQGDG
jgi:hypothetical protein